MSTSTTSSISDSISLIKLDELSPFGATKQNRLPVLIKLNTQQASSMPEFSVSQLKKTPANSNEKAQTNSLPIQLQQTMSSSSQPAATSADKENQPVGNEGDQGSEADFQVVDMEQTSELIGPSLPQVATDKAQQQQLDRSIQALQSNQQLARNNQQQEQHPSHLGDSLIEMIINLRKENQNLVRALETNNDYVKERLEEFKRVQEEAEKREAQFALDKAEHEHQVRKLQRQNLVLSDRLKNMEAKLKDLNVEVSESLQAARSSKASSIRGDEHIYPTLGADAESFTNSALNNQQATMQVDATSGELYNEGHQPSLVQQMDASETRPARDEQTAAKVTNMSREELEKRFDANKAEFYALDDPMKQCDKLEQQLNEMGKRDYEICLLQQQLNIYRQDYRLERMANLEAKIQIEKLKNDIDRLCLERIQARSSEAEASSQLHRQHMRGGRFDVAEALVGRLGHQLSKKAAKSAAKAAKYAAKQAHREEKAAMALARAAAAGVTGRPYGQPTGATGGPHAAVSSEQQQPAEGPDDNSQQQHHYRGHHRHHSSGHRPRGIRSEVVNDLLSTANKAMLTGYKMASTHVNLALDKLSKYEQEQAVALERSKAQQGGTGGGGPPTAPPMEPPSMD